MQNVELIDRLIKLVKETPNDMILGKEIRRIFVGELKIFENETKKGNDSDLREGKEN